MTATRHRPSWPGCQFKHLEAQPRPAGKVTYPGCGSHHGHISEWEAEQCLIMGIIKAPMSQVAARTMPYTYLSIIFWLLSNAVYSQGMGKYFYWVSFNLSKKFYLRVVGNDIRRIIIIAHVYFHFNNHPKIPILQTRKLNPREVKGYTAEHSSLLAVLGWDQILKGHTKEFGGGIWGVARNFLFLFSCSESEGSFHWKPEQPKKWFIGITGHLGKTRFIS